MSKSMRLVVPQEYAAREPVVLMWTTVWPKHAHTLVSECVTLFNSYLKKREEGDFGELTLTLTYIIITVFCSLLLYM
jgi:hypothetical protein